MKKIPSKDELIEMISLYSKILNKSMVDYLNHLREIEITNYIYNLLLEDYGLTNDNFKNIEEENYCDLHLTYESESLLNKTLVKKMTNLEIKTEIKYI